MVEEKLGMLKNTVYFVKSPAGNCVLVVSELDHTGMSRKNKIPLLPTCRRYRLKPSCESNDWRWSFMTPCHKVFFFGFFWKQTNFLLFWDLKRWRGSWSRSRKSMIKILNSHIFNKKNNEEFKCQFILSITASWYRFYYNWEIFH